MKPIKHISEHQFNYSTLLSKVETFSELKRLLEEFSPLVQDAIAQCPKDNDDFELFLSGLKKKRKGKFAGEEFAEKYSCIGEPRRCW